MSSIHRKQRFILVNIVSPRLTKQQAMDELDELKSLVQTYRSADIIHVIQRRDHPDSNTYIGSGKVQELAQIIKTDNIDVVVLNDIVKPTQTHELWKIFWPSNNSIQVWDRVDLILQIFNKHAHTAEAKLQIELARMRHMGPRIYGLGGTVLSRQGGGIGTRGIGETNIERMKRHWRDEIKKVQDKLNKLVSHRSAQISRRKESGFDTIAIVGYTNAGKTTLFNALTGKNKLAQNILFATLDSTVGKIYMPKTKKEIMITDTIGFIQNLPTALIEAFKSTLMEAMEARLLMHVIDVSDPKMEEKIAVVETILQELDIHTKDTIFVFNKIDDISIDKKKISALYSKYIPQFVSAKTNEGIEDLKKSIEDYVAEGKKYKALLQDASSEEIKASYMFASIMFEFEKSKKQDFPHNLGLLFLIENYLSYYLTHRIIGGYKNEKEFKKAQQFESTFQKKTLGQLFQLAKLFMEPDTLIIMNRIIENRNTLTHELMHSSQDHTMIEHEAKKLMEKIYNDFSSIHTQIYPK